MDGARFDRLAAAWARQPSRRGVLSLLSVLAIGGPGQRNRAVSAQEAGVERVGCRGRCEDGQVCKHGACLDPCATPGTCSGSGDGEGPPACGPAGAECACVALRDGNGYCLAPSKSDGCNSKGCRRNRDCPNGKVCAHVPGCCPDKPRICAVPCPEAGPTCAEACADCAWCVEKADGSRVCAAQLGDTVCQPCASDAECTDPSNPVCVAHFTQVSDGSSFSPCPTEFPGPACVTFTPCGGA